MADFIKVGTTATKLQAVPAPDEWTWGINDISASDAGRVQDSSNTMQKNRTSQKRKITLTWKNRDAVTVSTILKAFNPEYVYVRYLDAMDNSYITKQFYVGDRSAPLRTVFVGGAVYSSLTFNIVER